jgi:hypothetical protein
MWSIKHQQNQIGGPKRGPNPCSHIAARFCQRISHLRRVESTAFGGDGNSEAPSVSEIQISEASMV